MKRSVILQFMISQSNGARDLFHKRFQRNRRRISAFIWMSIRPIAEQFC